MNEKGDIEVIKVELPRWLAEKFRKYIAERYGLRRGVLSRAIANIIEKELGIKEGSGTVDEILGLGFSSDYKWEGEDLIEAFRRKYSISNRRQHSS